MDITVQRKWLTPLSTCGEMLLNGGSFCYTLEPRMDQSQGKPYAVPAGTYPVTLEQSAHFGMITPHVNNVPGFTEVEIHPGNFPKNTEACCLVGDSHSTDYITDSRDTFSKLMMRLQDPSYDINITITYIDAPDTSS